MKKYSPLFFVLVVAATTQLVACNNDSTTTTAKNDSAVQQKGAYLPNAKAFEGDVEGKKTALFTVKNKNGVQAAFTSYGGRWVSMLVPDRAGVMTDVILGFNNVQDFVNTPEHFFGATIGRYGNRIAKGKFALDGTTYNLDVNNGPNTLHGGKLGFHNQVWDGKQVSDGSVSFTYISKDGEMGFPGTLTATVTYTVTDDNEMKIDYTATTDKKTVCNLTNHAFFNLNGEGTTSINDHLLMINADQFTPVDSTLIPLGKMESVEGTPFDFRTPTAIGARVNDTTNQQIKRGAGYDHNFVLNLAAGLRPVATIEAPKTGIIMEIFTVEPGLQFYGGNFLNGKDIGKGGKPYQHRTAFCLETQHFPDSPNQPSFPSTVLVPGKTYQTSSVYKFSVKK
jgi:aldose 1-epimerase